MHVFIILYTRTDFAAMPGRSRKIELKSSQTCWLEKRPAVIIPIRLGYSADPNRMAPMDENIRFAVDGMLGALAKYLRALGYDTVQRRVSVEEFIEQAVDENRIILTRSAKMPRHPGCRVIVPPEESLRAQIRHLIENIPLHPSRDRLFTRCLLCNIPTAEASPESVESEIPPKVKERRKQFRTCPNCHKIYWWGTHTDRMISLLTESGAFDKENNSTRE
jgi:uncharacterized protein with PIN domain